jgi:hypothetical protein
MYREPEQAIEAVKRLGLPAILIDIWEDRAPRRITMQYARPRSFFKEYAAVPDKEHCLPLLEWNLERVYGFNIRDRSYFVHYYGDAQPELSGASFQQLVAWILIDLGYAGLDDLLLELAVALNFEHTDRLLRFLERDDGRDSDVMKREFVSSIPPGNMLANFSLEADREA